MTRFKTRALSIQDVNPVGLTGSVTGVSGLTIMAEGYSAPLGSMCRVFDRAGRTVDAQVVGFQGEQAVLMPLGEPLGISRGDRVCGAPVPQTVGVGDPLLGRVLDGMGRPIDGKGRLHAEQFYPIHRTPPPAMARPPIDRPISTGIRVVDAMLTAGLGQRLGIFAGTGVGKSVLMGMIARFTSAEVVVVSLVGERGREVRNFLEKELGAEGLRRAVVVVSTSDESPVLRVRSCFLATAVAEYFRDQGRDVLLLMDSLTRVAMAQRQIGLAAGEPPATKGYTPSVFSLLPGLLERSGRAERGSITGLYTVLVEGDDFNEPVSDAVRGILDGHVWLSRKLAGRGQYPAVGVLESVSRTMVDVVDEEHYRAAGAVREMLATWERIEDLVNLGAYASGSSVDFDVAIEMRPRINAFLSQAMTVRSEFAEARRDLLALAKQGEELRRKLSKNKK